MEYELCSLCGDRTGRAGAADDSIFLETPRGGIVGPLCEECFGCLRRDDLEIELTRLRGENREALAEVERLRAKLLDYDNQFAAIRDTVGGDASGVPDGYESTIAGRVEYEFAQLQSDATAGRWLRELLDSECSVCWVELINNDPAAQNGWVKLSEAFRAAGLDGDKCPQCTGTIGRHTAGCPATGIVIYPTRADGGGDQ